MRKHLPKRFLLFWYIPVLECVLVVLTNNNNMHLYSAFKRIKTQGF